MKLNLKKHMKELEHLMLSDPKKYEREHKWLKSNIKFDRMMLVLWILIFTLFLKKTFE